MASTAEHDDEIQGLINSINTSYAEVHKRYEDNFWSTKMGLKGNSLAELSRTRLEWEAFLGDSALLSRVRQALQAPQVTLEQTRTLQLFEKTFLCYITEDAGTRDLKERINVLEGELGEARGGMALGYMDPKSNTFVKGSNVQLRNTMRMSADGPTRKAAYEGLRAIGLFVAERFVEIVKLRNRMARLQGFQDYYDYKVTYAEGFGKARLFEIMDDLERRTRPLLDDALSALSALADAKGPAALDPHNIGFALAGDTEKALDPYFPFEGAVDVWARTFAALGINYHGATMQLDMCEREGKFSNGFCHWPQVAWRKPDGTMVPSQANFTSLASPNDVGSGKQGLATLLHEGGHAAHFANINQPSPLFAQERAPTSIAYAENQSMFLESLINDTAWMGRYALDRQGKVIPWAAIEAHIIAVQPYEVFHMRSMLAIPYFEKALYETLEADLTVEHLLKLADRVERQIQGGLSYRPLLSVPHILSDESSCYCHGYLLADMNVYQTRAHFQAKYGALVNNLEVGRDLAKVYWRPGNSEAFLDLVEKLAGAPLTADAWVAKLKRTTARVLAKERQDYDAAVLAGPLIPTGGEAELGMRIILVHGDEVSSDSATHGLSTACAGFGAWVRRTFHQEATPTRTAPPE